MEKKLFLDMVYLICDSFPLGCEGCPLKDLWKKKECSSCEHFLDHYQNDAELALSTWIGGADYVMESAKKEPTKTPETRREILQAAERCVCGDRDRDYGSPENNFEAIGALWGSYLWHKNDLGKPGNTVGKNFIEPKDVAAMMTLFKMARVASGRDKADNWVDAAGYAACGGEIAADKEAGRNGD